MADVGQDMQYWSTCLLHRRNTLWHWNAFEYDYSAKFGEAPPLAVLSLSYCYGRDLAR